VLALLAETLAEKYLEGIFHDQPVSLPRFPPFFDFVSTKDLAMEVKLPSLSVVSVLVIHLGVVL